MRSSADQRTHELARGHRVALAMTGEATAAVDAVRGLPDVGQPIVGEAHRAAPAMRDRRVDALRRAPPVEQALDPVARAVVLADLLVDRGVAPAADQR